MCQVIKQQKHEAQQSRMKEKCHTLVPYLTVAFFTVLPHEVDSMAVFIPEGALVGEGTVGDSDVVVVVVGGEGSALVVDHGVAWREGNDSQTHKELGGFRHMRRSCWVNLSHLMSVF